MARGFNASVMPLFELMRGKVGVHEAMHEYVLVVVAISFLFDISEKQLLIFVARRHILNNRLIEDYFFQDEEVKACFDKQDLREVEKTTAEFEKREPYNKRYRAAANFFIKQWRKETKSNGS